MTSDSRQFLKNLLATPGPSGDEAAVARVWRAEAETFADNVSADVQGNSFALLNGGAPRVLLAGHIDEIGLMVSHIDDEGFLWFSHIGGWDPQVFIGQRVRLLGKAGDVVGVIGRKPVHLLEGEAREKASKIKDLWIDIGVKSKVEALERVRVGTVGVLDAPVLDFTNDRIVSRSIDNRVGAWTVLEALRLLARDRPQATVAAVATAQEEITLAGARTAAFGFDPQVAIAVDVAFATDHPHTEKHELGDVRLGGGPVLSRGAANSPVIFDMLVAIAERAGIPYSVQITPRYTGTDADAIHVARSGIASAVVSIPNRYMHSPNEMIQYSDLEQAATLIAAFIRSLTPDTDFVPR
jgi:putative aminopeptidase FrvX